MILRVALLLPDLISRKGGVNKILSFNYSPLHKYPPDQQEVGEEQSSPDVTQDMGRDPGNRYCPPVLLSLPSNVSSAGPDNNVSAL